MSEPLQILSNAVVAKIVNADREVKLILSDLLSYEVAGFEMTNAFKSGSWDGRSSFFEYAKGTFPAGFLHLVYSELRRKGHIAQIIRRKPPAPHGPLNPIVDGFGNDDHDRDYQAGTVDALLRHGRGVAWIATGGGKSKVAKLATARIGRCTLFVTTRSILMYQMKDGFEEMLAQRGTQDFGVVGTSKIGVLGDSEWSPSNGINVAMVQTLMARLEETTLEGEMGKILISQRTAEEKQSLEFQEEAKKRGVKGSALIQATTEFEKLQEGRRLDDEVIVERAQARFERQVENRAKTIEFLQNVEFVIGEEAHEVGGESYFNLLSHCKNAYYRLALTGSPFMKADAEDNMRLMACFGSVIIRVSEKLLIDRGILAMPFFKFIDTAAPINVRRSTSWVSAYKYGIVENAARNRAIVHEAVLAASYGLSGIVLVQRTAHGKILLDQLTAAGLRVEFIKGETSQTGREAALKRLQAGKIDVLLGTNILDVGVDVPAVGYIILAGGGKAEVALRQRIGRGARRKKFGPNRFHVADFSDTWNEHTRDHARQRRAIIEGTPGFCENILAPNQNFDYSLFTKKAA